MSLFKNFWHGSHHLGMTLKLVRPYFGLFYCLCDRIDIVILFLKEIEVLRGSYEGNLSGIMI